MNVLIIDLTHGGLIIALEIAKLGLFKDIWVWDIYPNHQRKAKKDSSGKWNQINKFWVQRKRIFGK